MFDKLDTDYMLHTLRQLLDIPSPQDLADEAVRFTTDELEKLGVNIELTRRGGSTYPW